MKKMTLALALLAGAVLAQDKTERFDPASIMPAETVVYAQADGAAVVRNLAKLDLVRVIYGEAFKSFLAPLRENIPPTVEGLTDPVAEWLKGQAAVGVSGIAVRLRSFDGTWERIRITPGRPIEGAHFYKMIRSQWVQPPRPTMIWDLEAVAVVEPGPALADALNAFLENPPMPLTHKVVQRGARQILTLKFEPFREDDIWMAPELHIDLSEDRWVIATTAELLEQATAKERRTSFAENEQFLAARKRHTSGAPVLFMYGDARRFLEMAKPLLPPVAQQMADDNGIKSIKSFSMGVSIVDGGIRESWGIGLDEQPKGFWRFFDAMPTGLKSIERAPKRAVGVVALKFDPALFMVRLDEVLGGLFPGTADQLRSVWTQVLLSVGVNLDTDVLPGLGDEVAMIVMPPAGFGPPIPDLVFDMKVRNNEAFGRFMASMEGLVSKPPVILKAKEQGEGIPGWQMQWPVPPGIVNFRTHKGHLLGSTNPVWMRQLIANWDAPPESLAKDGEVFRKVMQGMTDGRTDDLVALIYGDLRVYVPLLTSFAAGMDVLPGELFKTNPMPDLKKLGNEFSGVAFGLRRDKDGVAFESFGPTGGIIGLMPAVLWSVGGPMVHQVEVGRAPGR